MSGSPRTARTEESKCAWFLGCAEHIIRMISNSGEIPMRSFLLVLLVVFSIGPSALAEAGRSDFRFYKMIDPAGLPVAGYWSLGLDPEVYSHSEGHAG